MAAERNGVFDKPKARRHGVTAFDVARVAGVSQSAVSRSFTQGASVAPATRARVQAVAESLGYRPNLIARSLITRRSGMIGVAIGNLRNHLYPVILEQLAASLQEQGFRILLFSAPAQGNADPELAQIMRYQVDGLVLAATTISSALAQQCRAAGVPVILLNRTIRLPADHAISSVTGANHEGGRQIADLLVRAGHTEIAMITGADHASTSLDRQRGFTEGLAAHGRKPPMLARGLFEEPAAREAMRALLAAATRPDAVFAASDQMAIAAMDVARHEFGLRIPQDLSIAGFDNAPPAAWPAYDLTTYSQPPEAMVAATVTLLAEQIADPSAPQRQVVVPGEIIRRGSCRLI